MTWETCCTPQSWWGWWQWTLYGIGKNICEINCGNCTCGSPGSPPRGFAGVADSKQVISTPEGEECYCDHTFVQRINDFINFTNKKRRNRLTQ